MSQTALICLTNCPQLVDNYPRNWTRDLCVTDPVFIVSDQSLFARLRLRDDDDDSLGSYHSSI